MGGPWPRNAATIPRGTPREMKERNVRRKREKKHEMLGHPPFGPLPLGRHPSGLPPFGPPTFWEVCSLSLSHPSQLHLRDLPTSVQFFHDQINAVILHQRVVHDDLCCRSGSRLRAGQTSPYSLCAECAAGCPRTSSARGGGA